MVLKIGSVRGRQGAAGVGVVHADPGRVDHVAAVVEILFKTAKLLHPGQRKLWIISQKE